MNRGHLFLALVLGGADLALIGCGGGTATGSVSDTTRQAAVALKVAGIEYGAYLGDHNGSPPKDAEAFNKYIVAHFAEVAADYNLKSADELLTSPRDGQPFVVVCGRKIASPDAPDAPWALYEQTGVDGKRLASNTRGGVVELSPEEFKQQIVTK